jgi:hypothetical protein
MNVYIVTAGEYSDYHICAVYDNREDAEYHVDNFMSRAGWREDGGRVEEYELNPFRDTIRAGLKRYHVEMLRNGNTVQVRNGWIGDKTHIGTKGEFISVSGLYTYRLDMLAERGEELTWEEEQQAERARVARAKLPVVLDMNVLATDEQHAVKIVNERRAQLIATDVWPDPAPASYTGFVSIYLDDDGDAE